MAIVGAFDVHRRQITFDYWDSDTGRVQRGRVIACREVFRSWLDRFAQCGEVMFAVEGCTGWRFVVEELRRAGIQAHLAEPADAATARGPKRRAKTDRADARHLRELLAQGRFVQRPPRGTHRVGAASARHPVPPGRARRGR